MSRYLYLGDRWNRVYGTSFPDMYGCLGLKMPLVMEDGQRVMLGAACDPVRRPDGKVIVGTRKGGPANALVVTPDGIEIVVPRRRLRLTPEGRDG